MCSGIGRKSIKTAAFIPSIIKQCLACILITLGIPRTLQTNWFSIQF